MRTRRSRSLLVLLLFVQIFAGLESSRGFGIFEDVDRLYPEPDERIEDFSDEAWTAGASKSFRDVSLTADLNETSSNEHSTPLGVAAEAAAILFNDGNLHGGQSCGGVCVSSKTCNRLSGTVKGACGRNGAVCCLFDRTCNQVSKEEVTFFRSPGYPAPTVGTLVCQHDIIVSPGTCGIRLDFLDFNTTRPLDRGLCNVDQFLILNSLEGPAFPRCGELTGYATMVPVDARHKLPLSLLSIIQSSRETFKWNIRVTQMKCDHRRINNYPGCGRRISDLSYSDSKSNCPKYADADNKLSTTNRIGRESRVDDPERSYVDNAFYIEYLKQTHQAIYDGPGPNPNETYCKNTVFEILKERGQLPSNQTKSARIIRGDDACPFEFPWQVSIQDVKGHVCGGAIINEDTILTASHCFISVAPVKLKNIKIIVGDVDLNSTTEAKSEQVAIHYVLFHSHFDPYYLRNDIAIIKLRHPIQFRPGVQPVCLPEPDNSYVNREAFISGWGATSFPQGRTAVKLKKVRNDIIENSDCKKTLKINYIFESMLCAVAPKCAGTCFGDSGGPLVVKRPDDQGHEIVGIVSFGIGGCALLPYWPDVYTRVTSYLNWLSYASLYNN